jgi:predicted RNA binding protein YcfA (HicA-like mRNA interferase family)
MKKGWRIISQRGSHVKLNHPTLGNYMFGFHDSEEIGPKMLARIAKHTGLTPEDL